MVYRHLKSMHFFSHSGDSHDFMKTPRLHDFTFFFFAIKSAYLWFHFPRTFWSTLLDFLLYPARSCLPIFRPWNHFLCFLPETSFLCLLALGQLTLVSVCDGEAETGFSKEVSSCTNTICWKPYNWACKSDLLLNCLCLTYNFVCFYLITIFPH